MKSELIYMSTYYSITKTAGMTYRRIGRIHSTDFTFILHIGPEVNLTEFSIEWYF